MKRKEISRKQQVRVTDKILLSITKEKTNEIQDSRQHSFKLSYHISDTAINVNMAARQAINRRGMTFIEMSPVWYGTGEAELICI